MPVSIPESLMQQISDFVLENPQLKQQLSQVVREQIQYLIDGNQGVYKSLARFQKKFDCDDLGNAILAFIAGCSGPQLLELKDTFEKQILLISVELPVPPQPQEVETLKRNQSKAARDPVELAFKEILKVLPLLMGAFSTFEGKQAALHRYNSALRNKKLFEGYIAQIDAESDQFSKQMLLASNAEKPELVKKTKSLQEQKKLVETSLVDNSKDLQEKLAELNLYEEGHFIQFMQKHRNAKIAIEVFTQLLRDTFVDDYFIADFAAGLNGKLLSNPVGTTVVRSRSGGLRVGDRRYMEFILNKNLEFCQFLTLHLRSLSDANTLYLRFSKASFQSSMIKTILCDNYGSAISSMDQELLEIETLIKSSQNGPSRGSRLGRFFSSSSSTSIEPPKWAAEANKFLFEIRGQISKVSAAAEYMTSFGVSNEQQKETIGLTRNLKKMLSITLDELKVLFSKNVKPEFAPVQEALLNEFQKLYKKICVLDEQPTLLTYLYPLEPVPEPHPSTSATSSRSSSSATSSTSQSFPRK